MFRSFFIALLAILSGCAPDEPASRRGLSECAQAMNLEAEAYERLERIRNGEPSDVADHTASRAFMAAARWRASACFQFPPDEFGDSAK
jgi:hypothetical protein